MLIAWNGENTKPPPGTPPIGPFALSTPLKNHPGTRARSF